MGRSVMVAERFVGEEEKDFKVDVEPVKMLKDTGDVVTGAGEEAYSGVLNVLLFMEDFVRCTIEDDVAVIETRCDK